MRYLKTIIFLTASVFAVSIYADSTCPWSRSGFWTCGKGIGNNIFTVVDLTDNQIQEIVKGVKNNSIKVDGLCEVFVQDFTEQCPTNYYMMKINNKDYCVGNYSWTLFGNYKVYCLDTR